MAESWFSLSHADQLEALEFVASRTGRPSHLLEKDVWVVWVLAAIYESSLRDKLTFKGGTSLSKAFRILDRFSEDVDLTYDIRELVPDLLMAGNPIPETTSQAHKITKAVRHRLPDWIERTVKPILEIALTQFRIEASIAQAGSEGDQLFIAYPALNTGTGYSASTVRLEFGARATGEPHQTENIFATWPTKSRM